MRGLIGDIIVLVLRLGSPIAERSGSKVLGFDDFVNIGMGRWGCLLRRIAASALGVNFLSKTVAAD